MATGLKRDPIVILRIDGEELEEYINSPSFEIDMVASFSEITIQDGFSHDLILKALQKLGVDQGLPPTSDSWVSALRRALFIIRLMIYHLMHLWGVGYEQYYGTGFGIV